MGQVCQLGLEYCSADRQAKERLIEMGFLEQLETNPSQFLPDYEEDESEK